MLLFGYIQTYVRGTVADYQLCKPLQNKFLEFSADVEFMFMEKFLNDGTGSNFNSDQYLKFLKETDLLMTGHEDEVDARTEYEFKDTVELKETYLGSGNVVWLGWRTWFIDGFINWADRQGLKGRK